MNQDPSPRAVRVMEVLNRFDPMGLIGFGAPLDEYEPEARDIAAILKATGTITVEQLSDIWERWFGDGPIAYPETAEAIAVALRELAAPGTPQWRPRPLSN